MLIISIGFVLLVALLILGTPVVYAFGAAVLGMVSGLGMDSSFIMNTAYNRIASFTLICVPLFVLAGGIIEKGRMGGKLVDFVNLFVGRFKCALAYVSAVSCAVFGALTGSASATLACIGSILTPQMKQSGYPDGFVGALFANCSMLGMLIPPSSLMIIASWSAGLSVLACFMSTLIPGIILCIFFCIVSSVMLKNDPNIHPVSSKSITIQQWFSLAGKTTVDAFPILLLPVIILGGIYGGFMTPTESAAAGAFYAIIAALLIYRTVTVRVIAQSLVKSATTAGVIMVSVFMVGVVSKVLTYAGLPEIISTIFSSITTNRYIILLLINLILMVLGMLMDDMSALLICLPVFLPLATIVGVNQYQFVAIMVVNLGMAAVTPPAAPSLYTACRICDVQLADMLKPNICFILFAWLPTLILTTLIPEISLFVPRLIGVI